MLHRGYEASRYTFLGYLLLKSTLVKLSGPRHYSINTRSASFQSHQILQSFISELPHSPLRLTMVALLTAISFTKKVDETSIIQPKIHPRSHSSIKLASRMRQKTRHNIGGYQNKLKVFPSDVSPAFSLGVTYALPIPVKGSLPYLVWTTLGGWRAGIRMEMR